MGAKGIALVTGTTFSFRTRGRQIQHLPKRFLFLSEIHKMSTHYSFTHGVRQRETKVVVFAVGWRVCSLHLALTFRTPFTPGVNMQSITAYLIWIRQKGTLMQGVNACNRVRDRVANLWVFWCALNGSQPGLV